MLMFMVTIGVLLGGIEFLQYCLECCKKRDDEKASSEPVLGRRSVMYSRGSLLSLPISFRGEKWVNKKSDQLVLHLVSVWDGFCCFPQVWN